MFALHAKGRGFEPCCLQVFLPSTGASSVALHARACAGGVLGSQAGLDGGVHLGEHEATVNIELLEGGGRLGVRSLQALAVTTPRGIELNL